MIRYFYLVCVFILFIPKSQAQSLSEDEYKTFYDQIALGNWKQIRYYFNDNNEANRFLSYFTKEPSQTNNYEAYYPFKQKNFIGSTTTFINATNNKELNVNITLQNPEGPAKVSSFLVTESDNSQNYRLESTYPFNYVVLPEKASDKPVYVNSYQELFNKSGRIDLNDYKQDVSFRQINFTPLKLKFRWCEGAFGVNVCGDRTFEKEFGLVLSDKDDPDNDVLYKKALFQNIVDINAYKTFGTDVSGFNPTYGGGYTLTATIVDNVKRTITLFREGVLPFTYGDDPYEIQFIRPMAVKEINGLLYVLDIGDQSHSPQIIVLRVLNDIVDGTSQGSFRVEYKGIINNTTLGGFNFSQPKDIGGYNSFGTYNQLLLVDNNGLHAIALNKGNGLSTGTVKSFKTAIDLKNDRRYYNLQNAVKIDARNPVNSADLGNIIVVIGNNPVISLTCSEIETKISGSDLEPDIVNWLSEGEISNLAYMEAEEKWYLTDYTGKLHKLDNGGRYIGGGGKFGIAEGNNELYFPNAITPNPIGNDPNNEFRYRFMVANKWGFSTGIKLFSPGIFVSKLKAFEDLSSGDLTFAFTMSGKWGYIEGAKSIQMQSVKINGQEIKTSLWNTQVDGNLQTEKSSDFLNHFPETITLQPSGILNLGGSPISLKRGWNSFTVQIVVNKIIDNEAVSEIVTKTISFYWLPTNFIPTSTNILSDLILNNSSSFDIAAKRDYIYKIITLGAKGVFYNPDSHDVLVSEYGNLQLLTDATFFNTSASNEGLGNISFIQNGKITFNASSYICANGQNVFQNNNYVLPSLTNNLILNPAYKKGINPAVVTKFSATEQAQCKSACSFLAGNAPKVTFTAVVDFSTPPPFKVTVNPAGTTYFNKLKWEVEEVGNTAKKGSFIIDAGAATQVINLNEKITYNSAAYQFLSCKDYKVTLWTGCNNDQGTIDWISSSSQNVGTYRVVSPGPDQFACEYDGTFQLTGFLPLSNSDGGTSSWSGYSDISISSTGLVNIATLPAGRKNTTLNLVYTYKDKYNCSKTAIKELTVRTRPAMPTPLTTNSPICEKYGLSVYANQFSGASYKFVFANNEVVESDVHAIVKKATVDLNGTLKASMKVNGCYSLERTANIIVNPFPVVTIPEPVKNFCKNSSPFTLVINTPTTSVHWTALSGVTAAGTNLTKTGGDGWDAGAFSLQSVIDGGFVEATALETNKYRMIGLSSSNADNNFSSIHFAIYLTNTGTIEIYERGVKRTVSATYVANDKVKIMSVGGIIKYYKNNVLFYTSSSQPTFPLYADASLYSNGATLKNVTMSGQGTGSWSGTGVTNSGSTYTFTPATAGIGEFDLTYSHSNSNIGCYQTVIQKMIVGPSIVLGPNETVCLNSPAFVPSVVSPAGGVGTWSENGANLAGNLFNPATKALGTYTLTYTYTNANNCTNTATKTITVKGTPTVGIFPPQPDGLRYKYYENITSTAWASVSSMAGLPVIAEGSASTVGVTPKLQNTNYGLIYEGYISVPTTGSYTFYLTSKDGSRLSVNDAAVITHDGVHASSEKASSAIPLTAGLRKIKIEYFNTTYSTTVPDVLGLQWSGPGITKQSVPAASYKSPVTFCEGSTATLYASIGSYSYLWSNGATSGVINAPAAGTYSVTIRDADGCSATSNPVMVNQLDNPAPAILSNNGLQYSYYENGSTAWTALPNFTTLTPKKTGHAASIDLSQIDRIPNIGLVFEGYVYINFNETYTFFTNSDDGSQLFIDDKLIVDNNNAHTAIEKSGTANLRKGLHKIRVTYFNTSTTNQLIVSYQSASVTKKVIPSTELYNSASICVKAGSLGVYQPSGSYLWSPTAANNTNSVFAVTTSNTYNVQLNRANGCVAIASKNVQFTAMPTASVLTATPAYVCSETFTSATLIAGPTGVSPYKYQWKKSGSDLTGSTLQTLATSTAGSYSVGVTDGCGNAATSPVFALAIIQKPVFVLGTDIPGLTQDICATGSSAKIRVNINNYVNTSEYDVFLTPGTTKVTVAANTYLGVADQFNGTALPSWWNYLNKATATGQSVVNGNLRLTGQHAGMTTTGSEFTSVWRNDISGNLDVKVSITNVTSSSTAARAGILLANDARTLARGGFCLVALTASNTMVFQYDLDGNGTLEGSATASLGAAFTSGFVRLQRTAGNVFKAYYSLAATPTTWVQIGTNQTIASAAVNSQTALFVSSHNTGVTASCTFDNFDGMGTTPQIELPITAPGTYTVEVKDKTGNNTCTTNKVNITIASKANPVVSSTVSPNKVCYNGATAVISGGNPSGGVWSGPGVSVSGTTYSFTPSSGSIGNNTLTYTYTAANGCSSSSTSVMEVINTGPAVTLTVNSPGTVCAANYASALLTANPTGIAPFSYQWKKDWTDIPGANAQTYTTTAYGHYTVAVTGCGQTTVSSQVYDPLHISLSKSPVNTELNTPTPLAVGKALYFDGVDDFVNIGTFNMAAGPLTIEFWSKPVEFSPRNGEKPSVISSESQMNFYLPHDNGHVNEQNFGFTYGLNGGGYSQPRFAKELFYRWNHWAVVSEGPTGAVTFYLNGENVASTGLQWTGTTTLSTIQIGKGYSFFKGFLHDVRVWKKVRTQAEIQSTMHTFSDYGNADLVGAWKLNEGAGAIAKDYSLSNFNGTITGATWSNVDNSATYVWSPATWLSSATVQTPAFNTSTTGTFNYTVTGNNGQGCKPTSNLSVVVGNKTGINFDNPIDIGRVYIGSTYSDIRNNNPANGYLNDVGEDSDDIFYKFTLTEAAHVTLSHCGSDLDDTYMQIYNENRAFVKYNDDWGPACVDNQDASMSINLAPGVYYITSEGFGTKYGNINTQLSVAACKSTELGRTKANPLNVYPYTCFEFNEVRNNLACYENSYTGRTGGDIYYKIVVPSDMTLAISTCDSPINDTYITLTDENDVVLSYNDDYGPLCTPVRNASLTYTVTPGNYYLILEGYDGYYGWMNLKIKDNSCTQTRDDYAPVKGVKSPEKVMREEELSDNNISLYPNPAHSTTHLSISNLKESVEMKMINMSGQVVSKMQIISGETDINTSQLPAGTYTLVFHVNNKTIHKKLVVIK